jgi:hypothetical protein
LSFAKYITRSLPPESEVNFFQSCSSLGYLSSSAGIPSGLTERSG